MRPLTAEWVAKAEGDFSTMEREAVVVENPNFEAVCFHAQQCALDAQRRCRAFRMAARYSLGLDE